MKDLCFTRGFRGACTGEAFFEQGTVLTPEQWKRLPDPSAIVETYAAAEWVGAPGPSQPKATTPKPATRRTRKKKPSKADE